MHISCPRQGERCTCHWDSCNTLDFQKSQAGFIILLYGKTKAVIYRVNADNLGVWTDLKSPRQHSGCGWGGLHKHFLSRGFASLGFKWPRMRSSLQRPCWVLHWCCGEWWMLWHEGSVACPLPYFNRANICWQTQLCLTQIQGCPEAICSLISESVPTYLGEWGVMHALPFQPNKW